MNPEDDASGMLTRAEPVPGADSILGFLTDGSILRLCATLGLVLGGEVRLLDPDGRWIAPRDGGDDGAAHGAEIGGDPWIVLEPPEGDSPPAFESRASVLLNGRRLGEFVLSARHDPGPGRGHLEALVRLLASITGEFCHEASEMHSRIRELGALFRLSSLLAEADSVDRLLSVALDLALSVLALDAGSIVLFPADADAVPTADTEAEVVTRASVNLSEGWLTSPLPLSRGRVFDRLVLEGHTLAVPDLLADHRVLAPERCRREGLRSFLSAALVHRETAIGVIRLYGRSARVFGAADQRLLRSIGEQAAIAVAQARLLEVERREQGLERQLRLASDVQRRMQPRDLPRMPGLDVAVRSEPSSELGGDIHDVFVLGDSMAMLIGDVVGKGVPAALLMSAVRSSLRAHASSTDDLARAMERANKDLCRDSMPNEFTTLWFGVVDPSTRVLSYCSAGHDPPLLIRPRPGRAPTQEDVISLCIGGLVLGINPGECYQTLSIPLQAGDVLVAYTDGVTDARNFQNEKWGWRRLAEAGVDTLTQHPGASASMVLDNILWSLRRFVGLHRQIDDETLIVLRVAPGA
jgi:sigma-B regulation protein RsbU (phosphoserine phosphatase)